MSAEQRVSTALDRIARSGRPEIWTATRPAEDVLQEAVVLDRALAAGEDLPLAGLLVGVKNNIDVSGTPTTAGCPSFSTRPAESDAAVVARLRRAGAIVIGSTNLDQFATGLVGTRSPFGAVRDARHLEYVSGGSSAGSAVAVALGLVDVAIGTDTAGSGRVPAAFQGVIGIKPTVGVLPSDGMVPACPSWDTISVFAKSLAVANDAMAVMAAGGGDRPWSARPRLGAPQHPRVGYAASLPQEDPVRSRRYREVLDGLVGVGVELVAVDVSPFVEIGELLYGSALVAERYASVGAHVESGHEDLDPVVAEIILEGRSVTAKEYLKARQQLDRLNRISRRALADVDALVLPTTNAQPTIAEVQRDPMGVNQRLGEYTNFCNLMDLCAVAVPAGTVRMDDTELQFGVTVFAGAFDDCVAYDIARLVEAAEMVSDTEPWPFAACGELVELFVVGAHLRGQPLAGELETLGARWSGRGATSPDYRLVELDADPPKPGLIRVGEGGVSIEGEVWRVTTAQAGQFLHSLPAPMNLGPVTLDDGRSMVGFGCTAEAGLRGVDISQFGGWMNAQRSRLA